MIKIELKEHQIWHEIAEILDNIDDVDALVTEHLEACDYKISGYWDENEKFYEKIILPRPLCSELASISIGITDKQRWIKLNLILKADLKKCDLDEVGDTGISDRRREIGKLALIYDENLQFVDENWQININSPLVVAKCEQ